MKTETTIKTLVGKEWDGKMKYTVTLADGTVGYLQDESDNDLKEGESVTAEIDEYTAKKTGRKSNLITLKRRLVSASQPPEQPQRPAIHVGAGKSKEEMKAAASTQILLRLLDYVYDPKFAMESAKVAPELKEWNGLLWSEIDEAYASK